MHYCYRVAGLLFRLVLVMYLDRLCIAVAGPRMQHDLHLGPRQWGRVLGAFTPERAAMHYRYRIAGPLFLLVLVYVPGPVLRRRGRPAHQHDLHLGPRQRRWVLGAFTPE